MTGLPVIHSLLNFAKNVSKSLVTKMIIQAKKNCMKPIRITFG